MIERITASEGWNEEVLRRGGGFLQSWEWGEFQKRAGAEVLRVRGEEPAPLAQLIARRLPLGATSWYCPRGPLGAVDGIRDLPEVARSVFLRFEPLEKPAMPEALKVRDVQPGQTMVVDLRPDEEAILAAMHEKWRYNIRLAERKGVRCYAAASDASAFDVFWGLMQETTERDRFSAHDADYYRLMLETLAGDPATDAARRPVARLLFAEHDGKVLAAELMLYFGGTATYLHGASSRDRREVMAPQGLHWYAMTDAKAKGFADYDLWGVAPEGVERHPWAGVTRFKKGFGGRYVAYPGTYDLPIDRLKYALYALIRRWRGR